ncbi:plasmid mobilization relaxosome protein MobC [Acetobacter farinalis]|nr:plasmid mobilization relaxosome protein MobC [Acetobacter farinalis]
MIIMKPNLNRTQTRLSVRASKQELQSWNDTAKSCGYKTLANYFRSLMNSAHMLNDDKISLLSELKLTREEVSRIGNNLNQIARKLNSGEGYNDANDNMKQCLKILSQIDSMIATIKK